MIEINEGIKNICFNKLRIVVILCVCCMGLLSRSYVSADNLSNVQILIQPQDVSGKLGEQLTLSVKTEGAIAYQWQYSTDGKNYNAWSWVDGYDKANMKFELTEGRVGMKFRCKITGEDGNTVYTNTVTASKKQAARITIQPQDVKGKLGEQLTLSVKTEGAVAYQWQYSTDGKNYNAWSWVDGYDKANMKFELTEGRVGMKFRCKITGEDGNTVYTNTVTASKKQAARITIQPQDVKGKLGEQLTLSVKTEGAVAYQWQYSTDGKNYNAWSWVDGYDKANMKFELTEGRVGMKFRCKITGEDGNTVYTNTVTASKKQAARITAQPQDVKGGIGEKVTLDVQADGVISYQWQYSTAGKNFYAWSWAAGYDKARMQFELTEGRVGMKFRCKITGEDGNTVYTNTVTASKKQAARITAQPQDVKGGIGEKVTLDVQADGVISYQWQYSTAGKNFYAWSWAAGYDKARMQFELTEGRVGMKFRCKITGEDGNAVYTNVVTAEKKNDIIIKNQPQDVKGGIGEKLTLDVQADGVTSYQWQYSTDGKNFYAWSWVAGYDKARMQFELTEGRIGMKFRCKLTGEDGKIVYTKTVSALHINYEEWETPIL